MNYQFENQGSNSYLVMELPEDAEVDTMTLGMITNNTISGVAQALFTQQDAAKYVKFNITAKITLKQLLEGAVSRQKLLRVFIGICNALQNAEDYMLDRSSFIYDTDRIYVNVSTLEIAMICIPVLNPVQNIADVGMLFKSIMFSAQFDTAENTDYVGKIINELNRPTGFGLKEFKEMLEQLAGKSAEAAAAKTMASASSIPAAESAQAAAGTSVMQSIQPMPDASATPVIPPVQELPPVQAVQKPQAGAVQPAGKEKKEKKNFSLFGSKASKASKADKKAGKKVQSMSNMAIPGVPQSISQTQTSQQTIPYPAPQPVQKQAVAGTQAVMPEPIASQQNVRQPRANFGETTVLGVGAVIGETTVLGVNPSVTAQPYLVRIKTDEHIPLTKPVFRVGKEKSYVDYFVSDNSAVSRSHANFVMRDNRYYVIDTNSTNHTYINDRQIESNVEKEISHGMRIKLANEEFEFRAY